MGRECVGQGTVPCPIYINGELVEIVGGLPGPVEAYFQWAMMHSEDIDFWRNR